MKYTLCFLPYDKIEACNNMIDETHPAPDIFKNYFRIQWIPLAQMISLVGNYENRTNNIMEGFNSYLSRNYKCHMNLWLFLAKFRRGEAIFFAQLAQLNFGADLHRPKYFIEFFLNMIFLSIKYTRRTQLIKQIIENYHGNYEPSQETLLSLRRLARVFFTTR